MSLLDRRIVVVTGKGGVGKSTMAAAIALRAAAAGKRTLIVETGGQQRATEIFGVDSVGYEPTPLRPDLYAISITPEAAIEDYVVKQIRFRRLYRMVFRNRVVGPFVDAVPGLHDAIQLGKVFDLEQETGADGRPVWDLIVVDAPATGHGLTMLSSARSLMELTRAGPVYEGVRKVDEVFSHPGTTAIALVTLPEEMPVNETLDLWRRLGPAREQVALVVLNEVLPPPFPRVEDWPPAREALLATGDPGVGEAVALTDAWLEARERQRRERDRLTEALPVPVVEIAARPRPDLVADDLVPIGRRVVAASLREEAP